MSNFISGLLFCAFITLSMPSPAKTGFPTDYNHARETFRSLSAQIKHPSVRGALEIPSKIDNDLTVDYTYLPPDKQKESLLILSSGIHGVEAFAGSAIQFLFLEDIYKKIDHANTGVLLLHSLNPYGYKYLRRVTENNVDLNRNFGINDRLFYSKNPGYKGVRSLLNPESKVDLTSFRYYFSFVEMIWQIVRHSMKPLRQAVLQGQYEFPSGIYFGGRDFEPQNIKVGRLIKDISKPYKKILTIDLHTGYGQNGTLHLLGSANATKEESKVLTHLFPGKNVETGNDEDFYSVFGDFTDFQKKLVPKTATFAAVTFEFGTLDSQTYTGALKSISNLILENQGHHHGYHKTSDQVEVKNRMQRMFYPQSAVWRSKVLSAAGELIPEALHRLERMDSEALKKLKE